MGGDWALTPKRVSTCCCPGCSSSPASALLLLQVVHGFTIPGVPTRYKDLDIVVIRENTEGEYSGLGKYGITE